MERINEGVRRRMRRGEKGMSSEEYEEMVENARAASNRR